MGRKAKGPYQTSAGPTYYARLCVKTDSGKTRNFIRSLKTTKLHVAEERWPNTMALLEHEARQQGFEVNHNWRERAGLPDKSRETVDNHVLKSSVVGGYVYVLRSRANPMLYKIGISRLDCFLDRLKHLKLSSSVDLVFSFCYEDYKNKEEFLHNEFSPYRLPQSEWFSLSDEQVSYLIRLLLPS